MKKIKILSFVLLVVMLVSCLASCGRNKESSTTSEGSSNVSHGGSSSLSGTYNVTLWVSEKEGIADLTKKQIEAFMKANPGIVINASVEGVAEGDAASKIVADVASAPDIYCFAQDQLARLVQAAALVAPGIKTQEYIRENNDEGSVSAATVGNKIWAYPLTSDNGYYMYYDKSIISEEDAESMEKLIEACERNNKKFRFALENAWYTASFFFATGCKSDWTLNDAGNFISVNDTFNSEQGLLAMKGMQKLAKSSAYDSDADNFVDAGVIITGIWNAKAAENHFGKNMGATDLPSFEVDGKSYHLGSFAGYKLMGVKPQSDARKGAVLSLLAQFLTNEECQSQRAKNFEWGPTNKSAQSSSEVLENVSLVALRKQREHSVLQGQIHGSWWDIARVLGADAKAAKNDNDLKKALENYEKAIGGLIKK